MYQHRVTYKKWLNCVVFATPTTIKLTSNKHTKNLYFRLLQTEKFWIIVVSVERQDLLKNKIILSPQSKGEKDKTMTKKELTMMEEMLNTIKALNDRIEKLENVKPISRTETVKSEPKAPKKTTEIVVGNLIFDGKYVKTGTKFMSSKARYAIGKAITEDFNGVKLAKGNPVFDKCHKQDKYVQVYEFKTVADCKKFMDGQMKRVG